MFNKYVKIVVGRLISFVNEKVFDETFDSYELNVIEEMMAWKDMTASKLFIVEYDEEKGFEVFDDRWNRLKFDY